LEENTSKKKKGIFRPRNFFLAILVIGILMCLPEVFYSHPAESESIGSVRNGSLKLGWLMPHQGKNFHYFSGLSYYILNNAYTHSKVYQVLLDAYKACEGHLPWNSISFDGMLRPNRR
jgi:hypothetical protein